MMRIDPAAEPTGFKECVHDKGAKWLAKPANNGKEPSDYYWNRAKLPNGNTCRQELYDAYHGICAYSLFRIPDGASFHVDHFRPKADPQYRQYAYDWDNYRLAGSAWNQRKKMSIIPDPFKIARDVCQLSFPDCTICYDQNSADYPLMKQTVECLGLDRGKTPKNRKIAFERYMDGKIDVEVLAEDTPFVAYEMLRQGYIKAVDQQRCQDALHGLGFSWV